MLSALRHVLGWLDRRLRLRWAMLVPIVCAVALLEAAGAVAVFGLFRLVVDPQWAATLLSERRFIPAWAAANPETTTIVAILGVAVLYLARGGFLVWAEWFKESTVAGSAAHAAERLFARYLGADYRFHLERRSAALIQEVSRSTDVAFQLLVASILNIIGEVATLAALIAVLLLSTPAVALVAVVVVAALVALPLTLTRRPWLQSGRRLKRVEGQQLHTLQQSLGAIKELKIAGRESFFEGRLRAIRRSLSEVRQRRAWLATAQRVGVETTLIVSMLIGLLIVTARGTSGGETLSLLALFAYAGFRIVPSANRIMLNAGYVRESQTFVAGASRDFARLEGVVSHASGVVPAMEFTRALVCDEVSFAYDSSGPLALDRVTLSLARGHSLGIVGATGSGKSTLVDVLLGLLTPSAGRVLIDDVPLAGRERSWQRLIGYVPQDPYLLDDTVRRNVAFGVPDVAIDEQKLAAACTLAQLDEVVRHLPQGLETTLGEEGTRLSGGQRQRVAIARALYHDPAVLVFDEATSALDNQTEREVTRAIRSLHGGRTIIVIAHRLSTVTACDGLVFLRDGRVAATGTYEELAENPEFRAVAQL